MWRRSTLQKRFERENGRRQHVPHGHPDAHLLGDGLMDRLRHLLLHRRFLSSTPHSLLQSALQFLQRVHAHDSNARQRDSELLDPTEIAWNRLGELLYEIKTRSHSDHSETRRSLRDRSCCREPSRSSGKSAWPSRESRGSRNKTRDPCESEGIASSSLPDVLGDIDGQDVDEQT